MTNGTGTVIKNDTGDDEAKWQRAHRELSRLAKARAGVDFEEGRWLLAADRSGTHVRLGFGSFVEYVERLFGYAPRLTQEKLRVAEALEQLPEATAALENGETCWSALHELTRVAIARGWFQGMPAEAALATRAKSASSGTSSASRSRLTYWPHSGKPWPSCAAMPALRSMMTRRCS